MTKIYDQFEKAFSQVSAAAIMKDGVQVARVVFKYPKDGAGRLYAYIQWYGSEKQRGFSGGGGYDKRSAACYDAAKKIEKIDCKNQEAFIAALSLDNGHYWNRNLQDAGFQVITVIG